MDESIKEELIAQFRHYLDNANTVSSISSEQVAPTTDLFSLFTELAGLRNEVKIESRQVKNALGQFHTALDLLQTSQTLLIQETTQNQIAQNKQHKEVIQGLLLELLELYDRLDIASKASIMQKKMGWFRFCHCHTYIDFIHSINEGQAITLRRLTQTLLRYQVQPLAVVGKMFDPYRMKAAAIDTKLDVTNGVVTEELRKGFMWNDEVLRLAEVKVNKRSN